MGVCAQDRGDFCIAHGAQNCLDMALAMNVCGITYALSAPDGARIDNGNVFSITDNPCLRAGISIG